MGVNDGISMSTEEALAVGSRMLDHATELNNIPPIDQEQSVAAMLAQLRGAAGPDAAAALNAISPGLDDFNKLKQDVSDGATANASNTYSAVDMHATNDANNASAAANVARNA